METLLINGAWRASRSGGSLPVHNPADNTIIAQTAAASPEDVEEAVTAAVQALPGWAATSGRDRAALLHRAMTIFRERYFETATRLLTRENGKPLNDSVKECAFTADVIDFYADEARRISGTHFAGDLGGTHSFVLKEPVGVAAAILPFNFPVDLLAWKLGPGLAAGCTFVIKPSEEAPLAVLEFVRAFVEAGIPPGVINVVTGGREVGAALVEHPHVRKIAFTGSVPTGQWIAEHAAKTMKRLTLELGGSAPFIVCRDADLDAAVRESARRAFSHAGQICISVNRIFVHKPIAGQFIEQFATLADGLRVTPDGLQEPSADMGPMINRRAVEQVKRHVDDAVQKGAQVLTGGARPQGDDYHPDGHFYLPTVLTQVTPEMAVMREETFGPVAPIMPFDTLEEAVRLANATPFGLAAYVYTRDLDTAVYAARHLKAGGIGINVNDITDIRGPFGGMNLSGIGRELGEPGLDSYLETKHVRLHTRLPRL
jgi:acyl-CoA reductase-like NAD-dependent aldehyde dehydrogenase